MLCLPRKSFVIQPCVSTLAQEVLHLNKLSVPPLCQLLIWEAYFEETEISIKLLYYFLHLFSF